jgi:hypothetical protein
VTDAVASNRKRNLNAGECLVLEIVTEWIQNPPRDEEGSIDYDEEGTEWVVIPAQAISDRLLERHNLTYSVRRTRTALNGLVTKGHLQRTSHIGEFKWRSTYLYRLPVACE